MCMLSNVLAYMIADDQGDVHVSVFPQSRINTIPHAGRQNCEYMTLSRSHELIS